MAGDATRRKAGDEPTFEAALKRLEEIVGLLDRGEAPLEEGLALFEEGIRLTRRCQALLEDAEGRIRKLVGERDGFSLAPLDLPGEEDA